ncbi:hypothetical protein ACIBF6_41710 [Streptosporangium amethystogenes]|uniref:hypothetical protein n=1 Tax=Streptosporangium amethystogenes TaxID=2002 RepID=UPI0037993ADD
MTTFVMVPCLGLAILSLFIGPADIPVPEAGRALTGDGTDSTDLVARTIVAPAQLPVGVVTATVGGTYPGWLPPAQARKA